MKPEIIRSHKSHSRLALAWGATATILLASPGKAAPPAQAAPATANSPQSPLKEPLQIPPSQAAIDAVAPDKLSAEGLTPEQYAFKQEVYRRHVARRVDEGRTRIFDLDPAELALIPGTKISMRREAALHLGELFAAARADLARDLASTATDPEALVRQAQARQVDELAVGNAYRSASYQFRLWDGYFKRYLEATSEQRKAAPGGEYGSAAADLLREYTGALVAAPGFSNHQGGIAVDLALKLKPDPTVPNAPAQLGASSAQKDRWKNSWFWNWLMVRAGEFGFVEYTVEPWHWEYKPEQAAQEAKAKAAQK